MRTWGLPLLGSRAGCQGFPRSTLYRQTYNLKAARRTWKEKNRGASAVTFGVPQDRRGAAWLLIELFCRVTRFIFTMSLERTPSRHGFTSHSHDNQKSWVSGFYHMFTRRKSWATSALNFFKFSFWKRCISSYVLVPEHWGIFWMFPSQFIDMCVCVKYLIFTRIGVQFLQCINQNLYILNSHPKMMIEASS